MKKLLLAATAAVALGFGVANAASPADVMHDSMGMQGDGMKQSGDRMTKPDTKPMPAAGASTAWQKYNPAASGGG